jgi:hydrogenase maturation protease
MSNVLIAGIGNIFLGDDGFGVEVVSRLARDPDPLPEGVELLDVGIGSIHLAYQLLDGYDVLIVVDALSRGVEPGTVCILEPDIDELDEAARMNPPMSDAHSLEPLSVLTLLTALEARPARTLVVGCEPADVGEGIGLSALVERAVDEAVAVVRDLLDTEMKQLVQQRDGE